MSEIGFRLLTFEVVVHVPASEADAWAARVATPMVQDAPVRAAWRYRVTEASGGQLELWEGDDRFAAAVEVPAAAGLLERRVVARALDHLSRWGWLIVAGRLETAAAARTLTIGGADGSLTLVRDGRAVALPLPLPFARPLPSSGPLTELVIVGGTTGRVATPAAMSALAAAAVAVVPGGRRAVVREVTAALRGVPARGLSAS